MEFSGIDVGDRDTKPRIERKVETKRIVTVKNSFWGGNSKLFKLTFLHKYPFQLNDLQVLSF